MTPTWKQNGTQSGPSTFHPVVTPQQPTQPPDINAVIEEIDSVGISLFRLGTADSGEEVQDEFGVTDSQIENARGRTDLSAEEANTMQKSAYFRIRNYLIEKGFEEGDNCVYVEKII